MKFKHSCSVSQGIREARAFVDSAHRVQFTRDVRPTDHIEAHASRQQFVGTAAHIADEIDTYIQADACDGFILVPHLTPHGLDEFVDRVVPLLQERGAFRTEYTGETLRDHLGLSEFAART